MIILKYFPIIIFLILVSGCKENDNSKVKTDISKDESAPTIKQTLFKGMCSGMETFTECGSGRKLIISPEGENKELKQALTYFTNIKPNQPFYVEAEGFSSARERSKGSFDTMLVITRFIKLDIAMTCD